MQDRPLKGEVAVPGAGKKAWAPETPDLSADSQAPTASAPSAALSGPLQLDSPHSPSPATSTFGRARA